MENIHYWRKIIVSALILLILFGVSRAATAGIPEPIDYVRDSVNEVLRLLNDPSLASDEMKEKRDEQDEQSPGSH